MEGSTALVAAAGVLAGAIAAVAGFGVGSVLTPLLGTALGLKLAIAAASIPHVLGTATRLWIMRADIDRRVLGTFGVASAAGGLVGASLQIHARDGALAQFAARSSNRRWSMWPSCVVNTQVV